MAPGVCITLGWSRLCVQIDVTHCTVSSSDSMMHGPFRSHDVWFANISIAELVICGCLLNKQPDHNVYY